MLDKGAEANLADQRDFSPLYLARKLGHKDCVRALLKKGACAQGGPR